MNNERDYLFASSFLKASDGRGTPGERLARFGEAASREALRASVGELFGLAGTEGDDDTDIYEAALCDAVSKLKGALPDFSVVYPLLYKYDCTNIKTAIKCTLRGVPSDGMLFGCGTVDTDKIISCAEKSDFSGLPKAMSRAAGEALSEYRKTGEVRLIDLMLDSACFEDMVSSAMSGGVELIKNIVKVRADGVNVTAAMRIHSAGMLPETAAALFERSFVPGGDMPMSAFVSSEGGLRDIEDAAARMPSGCAAYSAVKACVTADSFAAAEAAFDEAVLRLCEKYRFKPFGPEVAVRFFVIREAEMKNCRIIEASFKGNGDIREGLRRAYV